eukprot:3712025-Amphidinium_carterae.1
MKEANKNSLSICLAALMTGTDAFMGSIPSGQGQSREGNNRSRNPIQDVLKKDAAANSKEVSNTAAKKRAKQEESESSED